MPPVGARALIEPTNPLDLVEEIVDANGWTFDRATQEDMIVRIEGRWSNYDMFFTWIERARVMHFCCACDMRIPPERRVAVRELLSLANEKLWLGHFGANPTDHLLTFRHTVLLRGVDGASVEQLEDLVDIALTESDRFYPAFQFVVWGGKAPHDAITASMLEPVGEA
jgi:hypothetical protein